MQQLLQIGSFIIKECFEGFHEHSDISMKKNYVKALTYFGKLHLKLAMAKGVSQMPRK